MENNSRRRFVIQISRVLAFIPFVGVSGCISDTKSKLSPKESLRRLIFIVGPWKLSDQSIAEDFAKRFLTTDFADQYLPKSVNLVKSLSKQIPKELTVVKEIDLNNLAKEEQELLITLTQQLYSFVEIRFYVSNEPAWGECQGNPKWHTRIPE
ncbi:MAG: hypothetical protein GY931_18310 [Maribacter sp.]|nr:hypothetical protein [Maribacter sp.]